MKKMKSFRIGAVSETECGETLWQLLLRGEEVTIEAFDGSAWPFVRKGKDSVMLRRCDTVCVGDLVLVHDCMGKTRLMRIRDAQSVCVLMDCDGDMRPAQYYTSNEVKATVTGVIDHRGHRRKPGRAVLWRHQPDFMKRLFLLLKPHDSYRNHHECANK